MDFFFVFFLISLCKLINGTPTQIRRTMTVPCQYRSRCQKMTCSSLDCNSNYDIEKSWVLITLLIVILVYVVE